MRYKRYKVSRVNEIGEPQEGLKTMNIPVLKKL
jgi:hypothetical protein